MFLIRKFLNCAIMEFPKPRFLTIYNVYHPQKDGYPFSMVQNLAHGECEQRDNALQCKPTAYGQEIQNQPFLEEIWVEFTLPSVSETNF